MNNNDKLVDEIMRSKLNVLSLPFCGPELIISVDRELNEKLNQQDDAYWRPRVMKRADRFVKQGNHE